jgi:hypothetical protein
MGCDARGDVKVSEARKRWAETSGKIRSEMKSEHRTK